MRLLCLLCYSRPLNRDSTKRHTVISDQLVLMCDNPSAEQLLVVRSTNMGLSCLAKNNSLLQFSTCLETQCGLFAKMQFFRCEKFHSIRRCTAVITVKSVHRNCGICMPHFSDILNLKAIYSFTSKWPLWITLCWSVRQTPDENVKVCNSKRKTCE